MEDPRIISALFIFLKMAYYNVLINSPLHRSGAESPLSNFRLVLLLQKRSPEVMAYRRYVHNPYFLVYKVLSL